MPREKESASVVGSVNKNYTLGKRNFYYWYSLVWVRAFLFLAFILVFFVVFDFLMWFSVTKLALPKTLRQLGFCRYFTNVKYTNFIYKPLALVLNGGNKQKAMEMIRPRLPYPYLIRGKNYLGQYTYGFVGRYQKGYEYTQKGKDGFDVHYAVLELLSDRNQTYSFKYEVNTNYSVPLEIQSVSSLYYKYALGLPLTSKEQDTLVSQLICSGAETSPDSDCRSVIDGIVPFVSPYFVLSNGISVWERYFKPGDLILVKFLSEASLKEVKADPDGQYELISASEF